MLSGATEAIVLPYEARRPAAFLRERGIDEHHMAPAEHSLSRADITISKNWIANAFPA